MAVTAWYPCFLDVEASGFGPESWPVAVAWCDHAGDIRRHLVRPPAAWTHWDEAAARVHGLTRARLQAEGQPPAEIAAALAHDLAGMLAFSDAPDFDAAWLATLHRAAGLAMPFAVDHADDLLAGALLVPGEALWRAQARLDALRAELRVTASHRHDAGYDVGFLVALWRRACGETVKANHGEGPVPATTATGSFRRATP